MVTQAKQSKAKPSKQEKLDAYNKGRTAFDDGLSSNDNPFEDLVLGKEWLRGYTESADTDAERSAVQNEHAFDDPDVMLSREQLADLMNEFDNLGVLIEETQWRALTLEDRGVAVRWANGRKIGTKSPVPLGLQPFASKELLAEIAPYLDDQQRIRRVIMPCQFGKPSPTKPTDDDSPEMIKMTLTVPVQDLSAATANYLWGWKRCRIEFARRPVNSWDQTEIPGAEQVLSCIADVSGFSRNRTHWKFGFLIEQDLLPIPSAFEMWKSNGSCRIECLGEPPRKDLDDSENPELEHDEDEPDEVRQPSLFDPENDTPDESPMQFVAPITHKDASCVLYVWRVKGRFHCSSDLICSDAEGEPLSFGEGMMFNPDDDGSNSIQSAIEKELGSLIDETGDDIALESIVNQLKDELNRISKGGAPHPVTEPVDMADASY